MTSLRHFDSDDLHSPLRSPACLTRGDPPSSTTEAVVEMGCSSVGCAMRSELVALFPSRSSVESRRQHRQRHEFCLCVGSVNTSEKGIALGRSKCGHNGLSRHSMAKASLVAHCVAKCNGRVGRLLVDWLPVNSISVHSVDTLFAGYAPYRFPSNVSELCSHDLTFLAAEDRYAAEAARLIP